MPVKVLIVDDDEKERIVLRYVLEQIKDVEIVGEAVHGLEALLLCQEKKVDLVFLDITMPEMGGFETAEKLKTLKELPLFVFVTVKKDMAVNAYDLGALDYIVKPIEQSRIEKTIFRAKVQMGHWDVIEEMVKDKLQERINYIVEKFGVAKDIQSDKLPIREKGKTTILNQQDIIYCESQGKKVFISTIDKGYLANYTLNDLETRLDSNCFFRVHQAFIVNLNYIKEIVNFGKGSYLLPLNIGNKSIILSRSRAKLLREKMGI